MGPSEFWRPSNQRVFAAVFEYFAYAFCTNKRMRHSSDFANWLATDTVDELLLTCLFPRCGEARHLVQERITSEVAGDLLPDTSGAELDVHAVLVNSVLSLTLHATHATHETQA